MLRIGIDIGGTKINIGIFDEETKKLIALEKIYVSEAGNLILSLKKSIESICRKEKLNFSEIVSCGIGIPGSVSEDGKHIKKTPNISILSDDLVLRMEEELCVPVRLVQDSRAAAWGEYLCGGGQDFKTLVCLTLGTGIGTGIVLNGEIYSGALGCAGEFGHIMVEENGRACGCGKKGCLEKYCAGGGLDITASDILGDGKTSFDLFKEAQNGNDEAKAEIKKAVQLLGNALSSIVNLLSPDCMLLSGGLCEQEELYINPVIEYIKSHCYSADKVPIIKKASLGEYAPLYGAAFIHFDKKREPIFSASVMCADALNFKNALKEIEEAGIDYIHCDIMDNHFVPNLMLPTELLNKLKTATSLPFDYHIMAKNPETIIERLDLKENDIVSVHYESTNHLQKIIAYIKERGARAAVALNPATPISVLEEILPELDMVLIMSVNPGFAGQKIINTSFKKIEKLRKLLKRLELEHIIIQVDGNCSFENVPKMYKSGADMFVLGTSSLFAKDLAIKDNMNKMKLLLEKGEII